MKRRALNEAYARFNHYFWLPCPLCGQMFGGHEWQDYDGKSSSIYRDAENPSIGRGICPDCTRAGKGDHHSLDGKLIPSKAPLMGDNA